MAAGMRNQHQVYDTEHAMTGELFKRADTDEEWEDLCRHCDNALANPALPRWYRGIYEAMRAWYSEVPEEHIQPAKDSLEDTKLVLEAGDKDVAYIVERLRPLKEMIEAVEEAITLDKQADEESNEPAPAEKSARPVPSEDKGAGDKKEVRGKAKQGARSEAGVQRKRT